MINQITLLGHLGGSPEFTKLKDGKSVARFSLATTEYWKDKNGQKREDTEWHNIVAWDRNAEIANRYLKKGDMVLIQGKVKTEKWEDKSNGITRYQTKVLVTTLKLLPQKQIESLAEANEDLPISKAE